AVGDLDIAVRVDRDDIAGAKPAVLRPLPGLLLQVVIPGSDPGTAHFELAHGLAVPRRFALAGRSPDFHERQGNSLLGANRVERIAVQRAELALEIVHR